MNWCGFWSLCPAITWIHMIFGHWGQISYEFMVFDMVLLILWSIIWYIDLVILCAVIKECFIFELSNLIIGFGGAFLMEFSFLIAHIWPSPDMIWKWPPMARTSPTDEWTMAPQLSESNPRWIEMTPDDLKMIPRRFENVPPMNRTWAPDEPKMIPRWPHNDLRRLEHDTPDL